MGTKTKTFTSMEKHEGEAVRRLEHKITDFTSERGTDFCRSLVKEGQVRVTRDGQWYMASQRIEYREEKFKPRSYFDAIVSS